MTRPPVVILVKGYPRLSETFIAQEMLGLQKAGLPFTIVSLRHPTDSQVHELNRQITAPVLYLPEYVHHEPGRVLKAVVSAVRRPGFGRALAALWRDYGRDRTRNRLRRFAQAMVLVKELPLNTTLLYAHYLHTPSSVARYAALTTGLPWSFSAHAKDIWTTPDWELEEKLADAAWGTTCTTANVVHLKGLSPHPDRVERLYHGLDFERFPSAPRRPPRTGDDPADPFRLITVGRAVEKKGTPNLLRALAALPADLQWHLTHIGGGDQLDALKSLSDELGISPRVEWRGPQTQDVVIEALASADLFVLPAIITKSGDRDGLPNVLMEAQALGLPCLASRLSAIPELIEDGVTGRLVEPGDEVGLTQAIIELAHDPARRQKLAEAGAAHVRAQFAFDQGLDRLRVLFDLPLGLQKSMGIGQRPIALPHKRASAVKIAFYAPMKPPGHPVPSGDRRMARALMAALRSAGHNVTLASRLRSWDSGNQRRQETIRRAGQRVADNLTKRWRSPGAPGRPDLWFTYHLYHKAPDWIGPAVSQALCIPYVAAEASYAAKQTRGLWATGLESTRRALCQADAVFALSEVDERGLFDHVPPAKLHRLPPFIETGPYANPTTPCPSALDGHAPPRLIAVGMMRRGDKLASYKALGNALRQIEGQEWSLVVVGDGPAKSEIQAALPRDRTLYLGTLEAGQVAATMAACDLMVWPAINEAYGMALLEAQAAGLPVVAGNSGGVPEIIVDQKTGLVTELGDAGAFAQAIASLIADPQRRQKMAFHARQNAARKHDIKIAAAKLDSVLRPLAGKSIPQA